ncbi:MAG TPA: hypothetical protein VLB27_11315 [candidate division Zixibacteria bacterium]|nr:hypothetical protein [candidate division Zixibacteria bacterium]
MTLTSHHPCAIWRRSLAALWLALLPAFGASQWYYETDAREGGVSAAGLTGAPVATQPAAERDDNGATQPETQRNEFTLWLVSGAATGAPTISTIKRSAEPPRAQRRAPRPSSAVERMRAASSNGSVKALEFTILGLKPSGVS